MYKQLRNMMEIIQITECSYTRLKIMIEHTEDEPSNIYVFKLLSKLSQTCEPHWEASKDM